MSSGRSLARAHPEAKRTGAMATKAEKIVAGLGGAGPQPPTVRSMTAGSSPLGESSVDAAHYDGDSLDSRWAHGWHGGARVVPECDRFVIHADRATFGFMITLSVIRLWLCSVVFGGRRSRPRGHRGSRGRYLQDAIRARRGTR